ncbi:MAG TPA: hypothetical protein VGM56_11140, partial [Byssovorax sp.]
MRRARAVAALALASLVALIPLAASAAPRLVIAADRDDDDGDGVPDGEELVPPSAPELTPIKLARTRSVAITVEGGALRVLARGKPIAPGAVVAPGTPIALEGLRAGRAEVRFGDLALPVSVVEIHAIDDAGVEVDLARSHASIERTPPERLDASGRGVDPDAIRFVVAALADDLPSTLTIASFSADGAPIDAQADMPL